MGLYPSKNEYRKIGLYRNIAFYTSIQSKLMKTIKRYSRKTFLDTVNNFSFFQSK